MDKVFIIAEAGVNHNGCIETAYRLIDVAAESGADAVKFQTFCADKLVTKAASKAVYQVANSSSDESQYEMLKNLELDDEAHTCLINRCHQNNILFMSTPFDIASVDMLYNLGMKIFKVPSGEITNLPYLERVGNKNKKVILSTGMSTLKEIELALNVLLSSGTPKDSISVLHANSAYPTPMSDVNLRAMLTIRDKFGLEVGYSDHTQGIEVAIAAVSLGAKLIEKHFTLSRQMLGPDHNSSLEPENLKQMVKCIRNIELALGTDIKKPTESERENIKVCRKSIVATKKIKKGEIFTETNLSTKRPGTGRSPMEWYELIGEKAQKDYEVDELI